MKIYNKQIHNATINVCGQIVRFVNCVAEVSDELGEEILSLGIPDFYENGKQPAYETPKEIEMKADFSEKEAFYQNEIVRFKNQAEAYKQKSKELEVELKNWKELYEELQNKNMELVKALNMYGEAVHDPTPLSPVIEAKSAENPEEKPASSEEDLRSELEDMTKADILKTAAESGVDIAPVKDAKKSEIIDYFIKNLK